MVSSALLVQWDAAVEKNVVDNVEDLLVSPLLYGPVALQDNMILDSRAFLDMLDYPTFYEALQVLAEHRLVLLMHRPHIRPGDSAVRSTRDLLGHWLLREGKAADTVGFAGLELTDDENEAIRDRIRSFEPSTSLSERIKWLEGFLEREIEKPIRNFAKKLDIIDSIFFHRNALEPFFAAPDPLEFRLLRALGFADPCSLRHELKDSNITPRDLVESKFKPRHCVTFDIDSAKLISENISSDHMSAFFERLLYGNNLGRMDTRSACEEVVGPDSLKAKMQRVVDLTYAAGLAERNDHDVLYKSGDEATNLTRGALEMAHGSIFELADRIRRNVNRDVADRCMRVAALSAFADQNKYIASSITKHHDFIFKNVFSRDAHSRTAFDLLGELRMMDDDIPFYMGASGVLLEFAGNSVRNALLDALASSLSLGALGCDLIKRYAVNHLEAASPDLPAFLFPYSSITTNAKVLERRGANYYWQGNFYEKRSLH